MIYRDNGMILRIFIYELFGLQENLFQEKKQIFESRLSDLDRGPTVYKTVALPLS